jgi:uncharacterized protein YndB with AHSA1/START domain
MNTDRIEKTILRRAPRACIWSALTDSKEFGTWFGVKFDAPFEPGALVKGLLEKPSSYAGLPFEIAIEQIQPEDLFSFRWHPYAIERDYDYSAEPTTLVEFKLEVAEGGIRLTVTESGFDQIPLARRAKAFTANEGGWKVMVNVLAEYLAGA